MTNGKTGNMRLKLPFKSDALHRRIRNMMMDYGYGTSIIYKNRRLRDKLCKSAALKPTCRKYVDPSLPSKKGRPKSACIACMSGASECFMNNIVYLLECKECGKSYVGESARSLGTRVTEHNNDARNRVLGSPWGITIDSNIRA